MFGKWGCRDGFDGEILLVDRAGFGRGLGCFAFKSDWPWGRWSGGYHWCWLGVFFFPERGIGDAVGVVDVGMGGGSSGIVRGHFFGFGGFVVC